MTKKILTLLVIIIFIIQNMPVAFAEEKEFDSGNSASWDYNKEDVYACDSCMNSPEFKWEEANLGKISAPNLEKNINKITDLNKIPADKWGSIDQNKVAPRINQIPAASVDVNKLTDQNKLKLTSGQLAHGNNLEKLSSPSKLNQLDSNALTSALKTITKSDVGLDLSTLNDKATFLNGVLTNGEGKSIILSEYEGTIKITAIKDGGFIIQSDKSKIELNDGELTKVKDSIGVYDITRTIKETDALGKETEKKETIRIDLSGTNSKQTASIQSDGNIILPKGAKATVLDQEITANQDKLVIKSNIENSIIDVNGMATIKIKKDETVTTLQGGSSYNYNKGKIECNLAEYDSEENFIKGSFTKQEKDVKLTGGLKAGNLGVLVYKPTMMGFQGDNLLIHTDQIAPDSRFYQKTETSKLTPEEEKKRIEQAVQNSQKTEGEVWTKKLDDGSAYVYAKGKVIIDSRNSDYTITNNFHYASKDPSGTLDMKKDDDNYDLTAKGAVSFERGTTYNSNDKNIKLNPFSYKGFQQSSELTYSRTEEGSEKINIQCNGVCQNGELALVSKGVIENYKGGSCPRAGCLVKDEIKTLVFIKDGTLNTALDESDLRNLASRNTQGSYIAFEDDTSLTAGDKQLSFKHGDKGKFIIEGDGNTRVFMESRENIGDEKSEFVASNSPKLNSQLKASQVIQKSTEDAGDLGKQRTEKLNKIQQLQKYSENAKININDVVKNKGIFGYSELEKQRIEANNRYIGVYNKQIEELKKEIDIIDSTSNKLITVVSSQYQTLIDELNRQKVVVSDEDKPELDKQIKDIKSKSLSQQIVLAYTVGNTNAVNSIASKIQKTDAANTNFANYIQALSSIKQGESENDLEKTLFGVAILKRIDPNSEYSSQAKAIIAKIDSSQLTIVQEGYRQNQKDVAKSLEERGDMGIFGNAKNPVKLFITAMDRFTGTVESIVDTEMESLNKGYAGATYLKSLADKGIPVQDALKMSRSELKQALIDKGLNKDAAERTTNSFYPNIQYLKSNPDIMRLSSPRTGEITIDELKPPKTGYLSDAAKDINRWGTEILIPGTNIDIGNSIVDLANAENLIPFGFGGVAGKGVMGGVKYGRAGLSLETLGYKSAANLAKEGTVTYMEILAGKVGSAAVSIEKTMPTLYKATASTVETISPTNLLVSLNKGRELSAVTTIVTDIPKFSAISYGVGAGTGFVADSFGASDATKTKLVMATELGVMLYPFGMLSSEAYLTSKEINTFVKSPETFQAIKAANSQISKEGEKALQQALSDVKIGNKLGKPDLEAFNKEVQSRVQKTTNELIEMPITYNIPVQTPEAIIIPVAGTTEKTIQERLVQTKVEITKTEAMLEQSSSKKAITVTSTTSEVSAVLQERGYIDKKFLSVQHNNEGELIVKGRTELVSSDENVAKTYFANNLPDMARNDLELWDRINKRFGNEKVNQLIEPVNLKQDPVKYAKREEVKNEIAADLWNDAKNYVESSKTANLQGRIHEDLTILKQQRNNLQETLEKPNPLIDNTLNPEIWTNIQQKKVVLQETPLTPQERKVQWGDENELVLEYAGVQEFVGSEKVNPIDIGKTVFDSSGNPIRTVYKSGDTVKLSRSIKVDKATAEKIINDIKTAEAKSYSEAGGTIEDYQAWLKNKGYKETKNVLYDTWDGGLAGMPTTYADVWQNKLSKNMNELQLTYEIEVPVEKIIRVKGTNQFLTDKPGDISKRGASLELPDEFNDLNNKKIYEGYGFLESTVGQEAEITFLGKIPKEYIKDIKVQPMADGTLPLISKFKKDISVVSETMSSVVNNGATYKIPVVVGEEGAKSIINVEKATISQGDIALKLKEGEFTVSAQGKVYQNQERIGDDTANLILADKKVKDTIKTAIDERITVLESELKQKTSSNPTVTNIESAKISAEIENLKSMKETVYPEIEIGHFTTKPKLVESVDRKLIASKKIIENPAEIKTRLSNIKEGDVIVLEDKNINIVSRKGDTLTIKETINAPTGAITLNPKDISLSDLSKSSEVKSILKNELVEGQRVSLENGVEGVVAGVKGDKTLVDSLGKQVEIDTKELVKLNEINPAITRHIIDYNGIGTASEDLARLGYNRPSNDMWMYNFHSGGSVKTTFKDGTKGEYKLHITAPEGSYDEILYRMGTFLNKEKIGAKIAPGKLVSTAEMGKQYGKIITVYPKDIKDMQKVVDEAKRLHKELGLEGVQLQEAKRMNANIQYEKPIPETGNLVYYSLEKYEGRYIGEYGYQQRLEYMDKYWGQGPLDNIYFGESSSQTSLIDDFLSLFTPSKNVGNAGIGFTAEENMVQARQLIISGKKDEAMPLLDDAINTYIETISMLGKDTPSIINKNLGTAYSWKAKIYETQGDLFLASENYIKSMNKFEEARLISIADRIRVRMSNYDNFEYRSEAVDTVIKKIGDSYNSQTLKTYFDKNPLLFESEEEFSQFVKQTYLKGTSYSSYNKIVNDAVGAASNPFKVNTIVRGIELKYLESAITDGSLSSRDLVEKLGADPVDVFKLNDAWKKRLESDREGTLKVLYEEGGIHNYGNIHANGVDTSIIITDYNSAQKGYGATEGVSDKITLIFDDSVTKRAQADMNLPVDSPLRTTSARIGLKTVTFKDSIPKGTIKGVVVGTMEDAKLVKSVLDKYKLDYIGIFDPNGNNLRIELN